MKQFYSPVLFTVLKKSLLLFIVFLAVSYVSKAQVYYATLLGSNEFPTNSSLATGKAIITINVVDSTMRVQVTYSGLEPTTTSGAASGTTAAHIHAHDTLPAFSLLHITGVATQTPTFPGFPQGTTVRSGTYDQTFDMRLTTSYRAGYRTEFGGTAASAFAALKAQIAAGKAYLNIHSNAFPGGEIRGYLYPCPTVSIPDAWTLPNGTLANTVYPAYAPASSLTLQTNVSGGTGPYTYSWSNGATTSSVTVSPTANTTFSVTVTDPTGCPAAMASKMVKVVDISGGHNGDKIIVCHNGKNSLTIAGSAVATHLQHGDMLGSCEGNSNTRRLPTTNVQASNLAVKVLGNPSRSYFDIQIAGLTDKNVRITVYDNLGRVIETRSQPANQTLRFGGHYKPGNYMVEIIQGTQKQTLRLIKASL